ARLEETPEEIETNQRLRIEAVTRSLRRRGEVQLGAWRQMLRDLAKPQPAEFVDWLSVERNENLESDVGMHRHWVDPTRPLAEAVAKPAHGLVVTSATLTDNAAADGLGWEAAEMRTGARHLDRAAFRVAVPSPFDYPAQTRVFI